jgi:hypothetical protein
MRTFVLNDRGRYKFWDVELTGYDVTFSQGQVGRPAGGTETRRPCVGSGPNPRPAKEQARRGADAPAEIEILVEPRGLES